MRSSELAAAAATTVRPYRIDFALTVLTGNLTRYQILRPLVERERDVAARWHPIRTWFADDPLRVLPGSLRLRARHLLDSRGFFLSSAPDAAVIHAFEVYYLYVMLQRLLRRDHPIVLNTDGLEGPSPAFAYAMRHTDLVVPWSNYTARLYREAYPELPPEKVVVLHPGINLRDWPQREPRRPGERFRLLFVGGDYPRKGGDTLLAAFAAHLGDTCELDIVTQAAYLPPGEQERIRATPNVRLHLGLGPGSPELKALYRDCDCFVMPTRGDLSPWVAIESLATGVPVIISDCGGIPDIVQDGRTGLLIPIEDPAALAAAVLRLRASPELAQDLARQGRAHVEAHFDAERNTRALLDLVKGLVDRRKGRGGR